MANKSIEFVKNRIESGDFNIGENICDFSKAITFSPIDIVEQPYGNLFTSEIAHIKAKLRNGKDIKVHFKYNPNGDFSYMTYDRFYSDGTIGFNFDGMERLIWKVIGMQTVDKRLEEAILNSDMAEIYCEVGDVVYISEHGDWGVDSEKPWLQERTTSFLPIKMTIR